MDDTPAALIAKESAHAPKYFHDKGKGKHAPIATPTGGKALLVQPLHLALLNEAPITVHPKMAKKYGFAEAIFLRQLIYWLMNNEKAKKQKFVRFSYIGWQRQFPWWTKRYLIKIVKRLEKLGVIEVIRDGGVNRIAIGPKMDWNVFNLKSKMTFEANQARLLVFPTLAKMVGVRAAIILQQVHIRSRGDPKEQWPAQKSIQQWHHQCLMFISVPTLKRLFSDLAKAELLLVKRVSDRGFGKHARRVNYDKLKALLACGVVNYDE
jgi:hypothetical protein